MNKLNKEIQEKIKELKNMHTKGQLAKMYLEIMEENKVLEDKRKYWEDKYKKLKG